MRSLQDASPILRSEFRGRWIASGDSIRPWSALAAGDQPSVHQDRETPREGGGIGQRLAFYDACLVEQQPGRVLRQSVGAGTLLAQARCQGLHQGMARIDLEDTLRAVIELALLLQPAFQEVGSESVGETVEQDG